MQQDEVNAIVATAIDGGINFIDLADVYAKGKAERAFGEALKNYSRDRLVISSKVYWPMSDDPNDRGLSRKHILQSIDGSLSRIGTDYLDLYFCHRYDDQVALEEIVMAMDDLVRMGKILYWGTSVWPSAKIAQAAETADRLHAHPPRAEQPRYNLLDRHIEAEILPTAHEYGLGLVVWSPLAQGVLTGKYSEGIPTGSRADQYEWVRRGLKSEDIERARRVESVADGMGVPLSQLALAWCLRRPEITSVITGASRAEQVRENLGALDVTITEEVLERIESALESESDGDG